MAEVLQQSDGVIEFDILINGSKIKDTVAITEISIDKEMNRIASASITMLDGGPIGAEDAEFENSEGDDFIPGKEIEISIGYESKMTTVFKGIIVSQALVVQKGEPVLIINCKDKAVKMTKGRFNSLYQKQKDSDAISSIIGKYGISSDVDATTLENPILMQYNCNDWDFVVTRAEANNMAVYTENNELKVKNYDFSNAAFEINSSQFVIDIDLTLDSENIAPAYEFTAWNFESQKAESTQVNLTDSLSQGNLTSSSLADVINPSSSMHYSSALLSQDEMKTWGESMVNKAVLSKVQGKIKVPGTAKVVAGNVIELTGFSKRFNGKTFISKVTHEVADGNWITTLFAGKAPTWHASLPDVAEPFASGLLPAGNGVQIATVKQIHEDPGDEFRVLVTLPVFSGTGQDDGIWARLAFPYASNKAGFFFFPEIGDEVLLSFVNNDPRHAVITGSLYSSKKTPNYTPDEENTKKSIYTKSGIKIEFNEKDKILTIETPGENKLVLDDEDKSITVQDQNDNVVLLSDSGIGLSSPKDITIKAEGKIDLSGAKGVNVSSTSDVSVNGSNVELKADMGFTAKGNATAELSASSQTTVKGGMVMIN